MNQSPVDLSSPSLPPCVRDYVVGFTARRRWGGMYRGLGLAIFVGLAWLLVECLADRFLRFTGAIRWTMLGCNLAIVALILRRPLGAVFRRQIDWAEAAARIEERSGQFSQRLLTVTTQLLDKPEHRGSSQLLEAILQDVDRDAARENPAALIPVRWMAGPWLAVLAMAVVLACLTLAPWLGMSRLIARAAAPWRPVGPVTTTIVSVSPGNVQILQGQSLKITATAQRLGNDAPVISLSDDGKTWRREEMTPDTDGRWAFTIPAADRDLQYYVQGGDARTEMFSARVLRKPAVAEFRIRYKYPGYTGKPNLSVKNTDGTIEAPLGSEAMISIAATEPLAGATLIVGSNRISMNATVEPSVREIRVKIDRDQKLGLEMLSDRNVLGKGPATMMIRAAPDLPPKVKFIQPAVDLRLTPRDIAEIQYLATDDYGVTSLGLIAQVNVSSPREIPVIPHGDPRYREGTFELDLAMLKLKIGDLVRLSLVARDGAGHVSTSQEDRYILVSPRAIDANAHLRLVEAEQAESLSEALAQDLEAGGKTIADARKKAGDTDTHDVDALTTARQDLSSAADTAAMLREILLRAIVHADSPESSVALAHWVDDVQKLCAVVDRAGAQIDTVAQGLLPDRLAHGGEHARHLHDSLRVVVEGQLARAILSEREDLVAAKTSSNAAQVAELSLRTQQDIEDGARELGLSAKAPDLDAQLRAKIDLAAAMLKAQKPIDFVKVSESWIRDLSVAPGQEMEFDARLTTAAQAEALRPDANLVRARDLQLCGRAAGVISGSALNATTDASAATTRSSPDPQTDFVPAMAALQRDDEMEAPNAPIHNEAEARSIRAEAAEARRKMAIWAGILPPADDDHIAGSGKMLDLAMQANADTARHDYAHAAKMDDAMQRMENSSQSGSSNPSANTAQADSSNSSSQSQASGLTGGSDSPESRLRSSNQREQGKVRQAMRSAQRIDQIRQDQDQLTNETNAADPDEAAALAQRQEAVAQAVKQADQDQKKDDTDEVNLPDDEDQGKSRSDAIAMIQAAMERLAVMPQELSAAQQSAGGWRAAAARAGAANQSPAAAEQTRKDLDDATARQNEAAKPVSPDVSEAMSQQLSPFAPETSPTTDAIDQQLTPALRELRQAIQAGDARGVDRAAASALAAINQVQDRLREAQNAFVQRDPLVAAHWFAQAAAHDLAENKTDMKAAGRHQRSTSLALAKAWEQAAHQASEGRMMQVPAMSSIFDLYSDQLNLPGAIDAAAARLNLLPSVRDWATLRQRQSPDINASLHESDPPGYEASLKAYFEALNRAKGQGTDK